jgi:hypothetical protein
MMLLSRADDGATKSVLAWHRRDDDGYDVMSLPCHVGNYDAESVLAAV